MKNDACGQVPIYQNLSTMSTAETVSSDLNIWSNMGVSDLHNVQTTDCAHHKPRMSSLSHRIVPLAFRSTGTAHRLCDGIGCNTCEDPPPVMEPGGTDHAQCNGVGCNICEDPLPGMEPGGTGHAQCNGVGCNVCESAVQMNLPPAAED
jgi:hypothetical protein